MIEGSSLTDLVWGRAQTSTGFRTQTPLFTAGKSTNQTDLIWHSREVDLKQHRRALVFLNFHVVVLQSGSADLVFDRHVILWRISEVNILCWIPVCSLLIYKLYPNYFKCRKRYLCRTKLMLHLVCYVL